MKTLLLSFTVLFCLCANASQEIVETGETAEFLAGAPASGLTHDEALNKIDGCIRDKESLKADPRDCNDGTVDRTAFETELLHLSLTHVASSDDVKYCRAGYCGVGPTREDARKDLGDFCRQNHGRLACLINGY